MIDKVIALMTAGAVGSFIAGIAVGAFLRYSIKFILLAFGGIGLLLYTLQHYGIISINWDKFGQLVKICLTKITTFIEMASTLGAPFLTGLVVGWKIAERRIRKSRNRGEITYV